VPLSAAARRRLLRYSPLLACAVVLLWHSLQFGFITDDAYISFVYSHNFAEHGELVFNVGLDPVEGFTNFLWVLVLGLFMVVGLQPEVMSLVLGFGFAVGTLVVSFRIMEHLREDRDDRVWDYVPATLLALSSGFACWTSGGLETQMFTFWVALGLYLYARGDEDGKPLRRAGAVFALAAMTRPEGLLVVAVVGAHRLAFNVVRDRRLVPSRDELWCAGWFLALWVPFFAWRWWYYGYPFPNTAYVKAGDAPARYLDKLHGAGLYYIWVWAKQTGMIYAAPIAVLGALIARPRSRAFFAGSLAACTAVVYLLYVWRVGGDFMGLHRFIMPVFLLSSIAVVLGLRWSSRANRYAGWGVAAALVVAFGLAQNGLSRRSMEWRNWKSDRGIDTPAFLWVYTHDRAVIGKHMRECMRDTDFSILGGAGAKPFYGRMRGVDVFGLVSEEIAHEVKPTHPRPGHNKWAPDKFLFETYSPTFVFHCYSIHSKPDNARLNCHPGFWKRNGYEQVTLHIPGLEQQGEYYTFFKREDRDFQCPGLVE
jgi:hypothetical protein